MKNDFIIRIYQDKDLDEVIQLWDECGLTFPVNNPLKDIQLKTIFQPELFFVGELTERVVGTVMAGYEGHRGWINYMGVLPELQGKGYGRLLVEHVLIVLKEMGCPKVNLQVRETNTKVVEFYKKLGFTIDPAVSMGYRF